MNTNYTCTSRFDKQGHKREGSPKANRPPKQCGVVEAHGAAATASKNKSALDATKRGPPYL